jgi:hypothetical protein
VDATTGAAIEEIVATAEAIGEVTGDAGVLSGADMVLTAGIMPGTYRSAARSSFPKC